MRRRHIETAHRELDERDAARTAAAAARKEAERQRQRDAEEAEARVQREQAAQERREQAERDRQAKRRSVINRAKQQTGYAYLTLAIPAPVRADILRGIETELTALPVEEMPWHDVMAIADGVWARHCEPLAHAKAATATEARRQAEEQYRAAAAKQHAEWELQAKRHRLILDADALARPALHGMHAFRRLDSWQQNRQVYDLQVKLRERLRRLSDAEVLAMTADALRELVDDLLPATFRVRTS